MNKITDKPLLPQGILDSLQTDESGSVVLHIGVVRPSSEGRRVLSVEYQADRSEGEQELSLITTEAQAGWEIQDIALCRRVGKLNLGEVILVAAVAAPHHEQAFEACKQAVERTRTMASVKKREILEERN
jgi:molybdopterin synthase catalytic subunit